MPQALTLSHRLCWEFSFFPFFSLVSAIVFPLFLTPQRFTLPFPSSVITKSCPSVSVESYIQPGFSPYFPATLFPFYSQWTPALLPCISMCSSLCPPVLCHRNPADTQTYSEVITDYLWQSPAAWPQKKPRGYWRKWVTSHRDKHTLTMTIAAFTQGEE